jgi:uncharacterized membrane protein
MAFCPSCGAQVEGRFCPKCGAAVSAGPTPGGYAPPPPGPARQDMADNVAAALCYSLTVITGILFLVLEPYNKNRLIRFHAFQAIFFWVAAVGIGIAGALFGLTLGPLPVIGFIFGALLRLALFAGLFVVWVMLVYKAYNNERWVLPVIGPLAEKQANS